MFNKKEEIWFEEKYYKQKAKKKSSKSDLSLADEIKKFKGLSFIEKVFFNTRKELKFPTYSKFIWTLTDVINNYKNKPWFSKADALRMTGEKLKNKTLVSLSASLWDKDQILIMLKETNDKMYYQFQEIILEQSLTKTLTMLNVMKDYMFTEKKYKKSQKVIVDVISFYLLWYLLWMMQWLSIVYMEITQEMIPLNIFFAKWPDKLSLFFTTPIISFLWITHNIFLTIQYGIELFILFVLPLFILYYAFKTLDQYMIDKNVRDFDKWRNEYNYITILKLKTIQMQLGKNRYQKTNYFFFLKNIWLVTYERELMNIDYYKDFNRLLQIFETIQTVVPKKEIPQLTELFYVNFVNILEAYKWYITWSVKNFNLWYIYDRFDNVYPIISEWINNNINKYLWIKAWIQLFAVMGIWWYTWFLQVNWMNTLVSLMNNWM